tara:strand:- start:363 stop:1493 length:1131 start_codon:yes stop_codon:yes gene_type:complete
MSQIVKFGLGALENLNVLLKESKPKSIFVVTGNKSFLKCGAKNKLEPILKNYNHTRFFDFEENPKIEDVEKGVDIFNKNKCDFIIAVGGGSAIDIGKLINFFNKKTKPYKSLFKTTLSEKDKFTFVAIPTTAGSGSEATHFAVVYANKLKYSIADNNLLPDIVLIDHSFLKSQSKYQKVVSGLDAFCQGIESFWCVNSNEESIIYSTKAISLSWDNLRKSNEGEDVSDKLAKAAYFAGKAINITKTTGPHALSYGFTTNYDIPHGHAVSLFLPFFIHFHKNIDKENVADLRGHNFVLKKMKTIAEILSINYDNMEREIINFFNELGIEINFNKLNINELDFLNTLKGVNQERLKNNPRFLSNQDLIDIYTFNTNLN